MNKVNSFLMKAAIFPGQGSQVPGMGRDFYDHSSVAKSVFDEVSSATGLDLAHICFELDADTLRETQNAQIALFTCGVAAYRVAQDEGIICELFAGHSVGEYAALAAAGVLHIADAGRLVQKRGQLMSQASKGTMAAVLGLEVSRIEEVLSGVEGSVVVANDNCPGQVVISGASEAVLAASPLLSEAGAKRVLPLNVSGAFHSPLMELAAAEFSADLSAVSYQPGRVISNVTSQEVTDPAQWPSLLREQLKGRVRWRESVAEMVNVGATEFIEFGVGEVLCGMIKRIDSTVQFRAFSRPESATN